MKITNIKQILEITDFKEVNKKLEEGWLLLEIYQKDKCNLNYVLGNTEFEPTQIKIGTGIYFNALDKSEEIRAHRARLRKINSINQTLQQAIIDSIKEWVWKTKIA